MEVMEKLYSMADLLFTVKQHFSNTIFYVNNVITIHDIGYKPLLGFNNKLELMCNNFNVGFVETK